VLVERGQSYTYSVTVKNTGTAPEMFFPDARLPGSTPFTLGAVSGASDNLPVNENLPVYLVPTNSTQFQAQATTTGSIPLLFESQFVGGDPDLASTVGTTAALSFADNPIETGEWDVLPVEYGTLETIGPPSEAATTSASVVTSPFDRGQLANRRPGVRQREPGDEPWLVQPDHRRSGPDGNDSGHDHAERSVGHEGHRDAVPRRHGVLRVRLDPGRARELPAGR
jgi:hypothetical protein